MSALEPSRFGLRSISPEGGQVVFPILHPGHTESLQQELTGARVEHPERWAADLAAARGLIEVIRGENSVAIWRDHHRTPHGDHLIQVMKAATQLREPGSRLLVLAGLVALEPGDDYDTLPALAAAMIRLRVDQWVGVGMEAKALATQVGLEGSWDGESLWFAQASDAYSYLRAWPEEGDTVLITGHPLGELPGVWEMMEADRL